MRSVLPFVLGSIALLLFLDGIATIVSMRHYERRRRFFRMAEKAPAHVDKRTYHLINRVLAGLGSFGAGSVILYWIWQYLSTS
jgi:hypothetical protein